ncbi:MAG: hypothetical protein ACTTJH_01295 [Bacteroidales bacterium]
MYTSKERIPVFWVMLIVGLIAHSIMDMMPLFFGGDLTMEGANGTMPVAMAIMMAMLIFTIPFAGLLICLYGKRRCWLITEIIIATILLLFNLFHMAELFTGAGVGQIFIMPFNFLTALLLLLDLRKLLKVKD